jgi:hypothetical protein
VDESLLKRVDEFKKTEHKDPLKNIQATNDSLLKKQFGY